MKLNRELISRESVLKTPVEGGEELNPLPSVLHRFSIPLVGDKDI